jgi:hypothetical protein
MAGTRPRPHHTDRMLADATAVDALTDVIDELAYNPQLCPDEERRNLALHAAYRVAQLHTLAAMESVSTGLSYLYVEDDVEDYVFLGRWRAVMEFHLRRFSSVFPQYSPQVEAVISSFRREQEEFIVEDVPPAALGASGDAVDLPTDGAGPSHADCDQETGEGSAQA